MSRGPSLRFRGVYAARPAPFRIDPERAFELADGGAMVLDIRRGDDPAVAAVPGAERVPPDDLPGRVAEFPRDVPIVLACS